MAEAVAQNPQKDVPAPITTARSSFSTPPESHEEAEPVSKDEESKPSDSEKLAQVQSIDDSEYPHGLKLFLILISLYLAVFLMALVRGCSFQIDLANTWVGSNNHCDSNSATDG